MAKRTSSDENTNKKTINEFRSDIDELNRLFKGGFMVLGDNEAEEIPRVPSGIAELDDILGGGYPIGKVIEIYGEETSGKTWLLMKLYAAAIQKGLKCLHFDVEQSFNLQFAKMNGVDLSKLAIYQPGPEDCAENILEKVEKIATSGKFDIIGIDSTAALVPKEELEGSIEDQQIGLLARVMSKGLKKIVVAASQGKTAVFFINQIRINIGAYSPTGSPPTTTPGGKALRFYSSIRLEVKKKLPTKTNEPSLFEGDQIVGHILKCKVVKNRTAPPFGTAEIPLLYKPRRMLIQAIVDAVDRGILVQNPNNGKKFKYKENNIQILTKGDYEGLAEIVKSLGLLMDILHDLGYENFERFIEDGDLTEDMVLSYTNEKQ